MPVEIACAKCSKKYRVADKFRGKKVRCQNCSEAIRVPGEAATAVKAAAPIKAVPAKSKPAGAPPVRKVARPAPRTDDLDLPELPDLPDSMPEIQLDFEPEASPAPACPSCGRPLPASSVLCVNCGYHRGKGKLAPTQVTPTMQSRRQSKGSSSVERYSDGTRAWAPYQNNFLHRLESIGVRGALILYVIFVILGAVVSPILRHAPSGELAMQMMVVAFFCGLLYVVVLPVTLWGVKIAGRIFKFEVPEDGRLRVLAAHVIAGYVAGAIIVVSLILARASVHANPQGVAVAFLVAILLSIAVYLVVSLLTFMLFFHLRIHEAILGYLLMSVFYLLGLVAAVIAVILLLLVLKLVLAVAMPH